MKVIIAGSRHMTQSELIPPAVAASGFLVTEVVCGCATGADTLGNLWAQANNIPVKYFPAEWKKYHRGAGPIRNKQMLDYADALIVFIWTNSRGSENMLSQTLKAGKPAFVVRDGILPPICGN